jgi:hypothetical protein
MLASVFIVLTSFFFLISLFVSVEWSWYFVGRTLATCIFIGLVAATAVFLKQKGAHLSWVECLMLLCQLTIGIGLIARSLGTVTGIMPRDSEAVSPWISLSLGATLVLLVWGIVRDSWSAYFIEAAFVLGLAVLATVYLAEHIDGSWSVHALNLLPLAYLTLQLVFCFKYLVLRGFERWRLLHSP